MYHNTSRVKAQRHSQIRRQDPGASPQTPPEDVSSGHLSILLLFTRWVKSKRIKETRKLSPAADAGHGRDSARFKPADLGHSPIRRKGFACCSERKNGLRQIQHLLGRAQTGQGQLPSVRVVQTYAASARGDPVQLSGHGPEFGGVLPRPIAQGPGLLHDATYLAGLRGVNLDEICLFPVVNTSVAHSVIPSVVLRKRRSQIPVDIHAARHGTRILRVDSLPIR